jgi:hypothetical protein
MRQLIEKRCADCHPRLFVEGDAAALIADASLKGLLDGGFTRLWETVFHRRDVAKLKGPLFGLSDRRGHEIVCCSYH